MRRQQKTAGFTLIELLILLAILGILIGLLLPAINAAREAARRNSCANKMRQLGLASMNYQSANGTFPVTVRWFDGKLHALTKTNVPGKESATPSATTDDGHSWIAMILPFIEERELFEKIDFDKGPFHKDNVAVANTKIPILNCSSFGGELDNIGMEGQKVAITQYAAMSATTLPRMLDGKKKLAKGEGANGGLVSYVKLGDRDHTDGMSKTILLCETREPVYAAWTSGIATSLFGLHGKDAPTINVGPMLKPSDPLTQVSRVMSADDWGGTAARSWAVSSVHPGIAHHSFGDGGVRAIANDIDPSAYKALITRSSALSEGKNDNADIEDFFIRN